MAKIIEMRKRICFVFLVIVMAFSIKVMYQDTTKQIQNDNGKTDKIAKAVIEDVTMGEKIIDFALVYNYDYYVQNGHYIPENSENDAVNAFLDFLEYGMDTPVMASAGFDSMFYRANNEDLAEKYGENWMAYYLHYVLYGYKEGRQGTIEGDNSQTSNTDVINFDLIFNMNNYLECNPDIANVIDTEDGVLVLEHFIRYGLAEGRTAIE